MPFPRRVYDPPPATNEEIAIVLRKLQIWRKELKGLLISITPHNTPTELIGSRRTVERAIVPHAFAKLNPWL